MTDLRLHIVRRSQSNIYAECSRVEALFQHHTCAPTNPYLLGLGVVATVGAITVAGNIASDALNDAGLEV